MLPSHSCATCAAEPALESEPSRLQAVTGFGPVPTWSTTTAPTLATPVSYPNFCPSVGSPNGMTSGNSYALSLNSVFCATKSLCFAAGGFMGLSSLPNPTTGPSCTPTARFWFPSTVAPSGMCAPPPLPLNCIPRYKPPSLATVCHNAAGAVCQPGTWRDHGAPRRSAVCWRRLPCPAHLRGGLSVLSVQTSELGYEWLGVHLWIQLGHRSHRNRDGGWWHHSGAQLCFLVLSSTLAHFAS